MTRMTGVSIAVAVVLSLAMASDSQAFWGSRGSSGSCGSSGGSWGSSGGSWGSSGSSGGSWGSSGGSWGSCGSSGGGGLLSRIFNHGSSGSCGSSGGYSYSSCGSSGGYSSCGSSGGAAYYGGVTGGNYVTTSRPTATYASVATPTPVVKTELKLRVPADAKVTLAGVATKQTGEVRQFATSNLASGQAWQNYQVVVEMNRDGKPVREERTITLVGGQTQELSFVSGDTKVASLTP